MVQAGRKSIAVGVLLYCSILRPQDPASSLDTTGEATVDGRSTSYLIHHLPVNAFPELPPAVAAGLTHRGCLIPQTYEAHHPENVVHASFEHRGSSDWAVLCSAKGIVSLLVFLASSNGDATVLATAPEISRLQAHGSRADLGFNWAIDPASPEQVHEAQLGMRHPPPRLDHDALADSTIDQKTIYRSYGHGAWTTLDTQD